jgi:acetoin utilization protein AcuB
MYVGWCMKSSLHTVSLETSVFKAREIMEAHRISHLPVTDGKAHLLGIVTDRDLKEAWASPATTLSIHELTYVLQKLNVANVMTKKVITATRDMTIERAAQMMLQHKIGALPVLEGGKLVGIITITDLMEVLLTAVGMGDDTRRLSLLVRDRVGMLAEIGKCMQQADINIASVMTVPLVGHEHVWQFILRVKQADVEQAFKALTQAGFKPVTEYVEDLTPYLPH